MKFLPFFVCLIILFHTHETKAEDIKEDTISYQLLKAQMLSDENIINSFCYDKKLTINRGMKEDCLLSNRYVKSTFISLEVNNQRININKLAYCIKNGRVKVGADSLKSSKFIKYLDYYIVTFEKKDTLMSQYISKLKEVSYKITVPETEFPFTCYLFMKEDRLIILSHEYFLLRLPDDKVTDRRNEFDIEKIIEKIKE